MKDVVAVQCPTTALAVSETVPTRPHDRELRWHERAKNRFGIVLFAAMSFLGVAQAQTFATQLPPDPSVCASANKQPWQGGSAPAAPGHWYNPKRTGTGWDLVYSDDKKSLKAFLYTYSPAPLGYPTWLATPMTALRADGTFVAQLKSYTSNNLTGQTTGTTVGSVAFRFLPNDPTKIAISWDWNSIDTFPGGHPQLECIQDIVRAGPNNPGIASSAAPTDGTASVTGPGINQLWTGYWNTTGPTDIDSVPGVNISILQTSSGAEVGQFAEFDLLVTFDASGQPVWLQAQSDTVPRLPNPSTQDLNMGYDQPVAASYPQGVPIHDCPAGGTCITTPTPLIGKLTRTYATGAAYGTRATMSVAITQQPANSFNPSSAAQLLGGAGTFPSTSPTTIWKTTSSTGIVVDEYSCYAGYAGGTCAVSVSWNGPGTPWRHNLNTNAYTQLSSDANGVLLDTLTEGDRVDYELWNGTASATGLPADKTAEVRAYGPTNADGTAYVPDAPQTSLSGNGELPANDASVGTMAGSAGVDGGAATYTIPIVLPPGRNGMQPEVSLNYNSRSGNGIAGMGWSLSGASSIHLCPKTVAQDGINRGVQLDANDRLCLDGQRLVPISGNYGVGGTIYDTEVRSFSEVTQSNALNSQFSSFSVRMKDGRTLTYGMTPAGSRCVSNVSQVIPGGVAAPLSWLLTQTKDPQGNWMDYCYSAGAAGEVLLKNIVYTSAAGLAGNRAVHMEYQPRPTMGTANDVSVSYIAGGLSFQTQRLQSIATYVNYVNDANKGALVRSYTLNYKASIASPDYDAHSGRSLLWSVQECGAVVGTTPAPCRKATQFNWADGPSKYGFTNLTLSSTLGAITGAGVVPDPQPSDTSMAQPPQIGTTGDFDGDGSREVVVSQYQGDAITGTTHLYVAKSHTDRTIGVPVDVTSLENGGFALSAIGTGLSADFGGDGKTAVLGGATLANPSLNLLSWQLGRGVAIPVGATADTLFRKIPTYIPLPAGSNIVAVTDFNGDGYPDVLVSLPTSVLQSGMCPAAIPANGHLGPSPPVGRGGDPITPPALASVDTGASSATTTFNALCLYRNTTRAPITSAMSSYGFTAVPLPPITTLTIVSGPGASLSAQQVDHVTDFNADGAADIWISTITVGFTTVKSLTSLIQAQPQPCTGAGCLPDVTFIARDPTVSIKVDSRVVQGAAGVSVHWLDVNGDGLEDLAFAVPPVACNLKDPSQCPAGTCPPNSTCPPGTWQVQLNTSGKLSPVLTPISGANLGLIVSGGSMRYADSMPTADVEDSGLASLLFPTKFAARVCSFQALRPLQPLECTGTAIAPGGSSIAGSTSTTIGPPYTCLVWACPEEPDPTSATATEDPVAVPPDATDHGLGIVKMYGKHRGIDDSSSYYMSALHFTHSLDAGGNDQIAVISSPTSIIARLNSGPDRQADLFGDGLADYTTLVGCNQTVTYAPNSDPNDNVVFPACWPLIGPASSGKSYGPANLPDGTPVASLQTHAYQYLNANTGVASLGPSGLPILPELMQSAVNGMQSPSSGLGDTATWDYFPLSTGGGRAATQLPLYNFSNSISYVADPEYYFFTSSMPVVGTFTQSNGVDSSGNGFRSSIYGYDGAIYDHLGRGFQGFRQISVDPLLGNGGLDLNNHSRGLRTVTTYAQKFPLTGKIVEEDVGVVISGTSMTNVSTTNNNYACTLSVGAAPLRTQFCPGDPGAVIPVATAQGGVYFPFLDTSFTYTYDLANAQQATLSLISIIGTYNASISSAARGNGTSGWDQYGNIKTQIVAKTDFDSAALLTQLRTTTTNVYDNSLATSTGGWTNKLQSSTAAQLISYPTTHAAPSSVTTSGQTVTSMYGWNCDRSLSWKATVDVIAGAAPAGQVGCNSAATTSTPPAASGVMATTAYTYPSTSYGLPLTTTVNASIPASAPAGTTFAPRITTYGYSNDGYFVNSTKNPLQQTTTMNVRPEDGQPTSVTDPNSLIATTGYDGFGHAIATTYTNPIGAQQPMTQTAWTNCLTGTGPTTCSNDGEGAASYISTTVQDGAPTQVVAYDILGRVIDKAARGFNTNPATGTGIFVHEKTNYDSMGTVLSTTAPYYQGATQFPSTRFWYDAQNRVLQKLAPTADLNPVQGNTLTKYTYSGDTTTIAVTVGASCSPVNLCFQMKRIGSVLGKYVQTTETDPTTGSVVTDYWYDAAGNAAGIRDGKGSTTSAVYNGFGQRTQSNDPNQGVWNFVYDGLGELIQQTDARGAITAVTSRDLLGRVATQTATPPAGGAPGMTNEITQDTWSYDSPVIGAPTTITRLRGATPSTLVNVWSETYTYDAYTKRLTKRSTTQEKETGGALVTRYQYDAYYGREKAITYPSGFTAWRQYNSYGDLSSLLDATGLTPAWTKLQADAFGHTTGEQFGYAAVGTHTYSAGTGQAKSMNWTSLPNRINGTTTAIDGVTYIYDSLGNLTNQTRNGASETYAYDSLQRLTGTTRSNGQPVNYVYDAVGNLMSKSDYSTSSPTAYTYDSIKRNAVTSVALAGGTTTATFDYDANGNEIGQGAATALHESYDVNNQARTIQRAGTGVATFFYGPTGARYREEAPSNTTIFGSDGYERSGGLHRHELGPVVFTGGGTTTTPVYMLRDRLGSVLTEVDINGNVYSNGAAQRSYDAFGKVRNKDFSDTANGILLLQPVTLRGFTGQEHQDDARVIHMNGRIYDYNLGRFLGVDPIIGNPLSSQSLNPYSYIGNNPLSGTDPSGYNCQEDKNGAVTSTCLMSNDGINKITDAAGKEVGTVIVASKGDNITVTGNGGSISSTFTGKTGDISRVLSGGPPSDLGAISQRTNGTLDGTTASYAYGQDKSPATVQGLPWTDAQRQQYTQANHTQFSPWMEGARSLGLSTGEFFFDGPANQPGDDSIQPWGTSIPVPAAAGATALKAGGGVLLAQLAKFELHHAWPKYLGGAEKQVLERLPKELHDAFHRGLDNTVPRYLGKKYYEQLSGAERGEVYKKFEAYTRAFDQKFGTNLLDAAQREGFSTP